jgi:general secretion pathway protein H
MVRKEGSVWLPISRIGENDPNGNESGFTLLEVVCVLAIIAILSAMLLPAFPRGTTRAQLESYALDIAGLLTADRNAALRRGGEIVTRIDAKRRLVRAGASARTVKLPDDVTVSSVLSARCNSSAPGSALTFFPSGMSCGGAVSVSRMSVGYEVRVSWFTGGVEIVPLSHM